MSRRLRAFARRRRDPLLILPYLGYGTARKAILCGRVLQDEGIPPAVGGERRWRNLVAFFKRLESDEVPHARLCARFRRKTVETVSNGEGYFRVEIAARFPRGWNEIELELAERPAVRALGRVLVPSPHAAFGVVSDIDDTVVESHVASRVRMILTAALSNARQRKPFPGVTAFYRALHRGVNPFFYVSKSPWNLYVPIVEYLEHQRLPPGPLVLRDFGRRMNKAHKTLAIEAILQTYPALPFVLVGDSGEEDEAIYRRLARRFPGRVRAIYIRSPLRRIDIVAGGTPLVLSPESAFAAAHAARIALIPALKKGSDPFSVARRAAPSARRRGTGARSRRHRPAR